MSASAYTPAVAAKLVELISAGMSRERACRAIGVGARTLRDWLTRERRGDATYGGDLGERLRQAEAKAEGDALDQIRAAARDGAWQAAAWYLERRYPDRYGRREPRDRSRKPSQEVRPVDSPEYLAAALALVAAAQRGPVGTVQPGGPGDGGVGRLVEAAAAPGVIEPQAVGGMRPPA